MFQNELLEKKIVKVFFFFYFLIFKNTVENKKIKPFKKQLLYRKFFKFHTDQMSIKIVLPFT